MKQRLQKILSERGICSRRKGEALIREGRIQVNGEIAVLGTTADPEQDTILLDGQALPQRQRLVYILLNKPRGYVTTLHDEKGRPDAAQLVADCGTRVYPVGRLDMDSEGLLLFTNDGEFANLLMHPKQEVEKTYLVWVTGFVPGKERELARPILLDGYRIRPPKVRLLKSQEDRAQLEITIHEGRNRQIRRMCQEAGMVCIRLRRIREGSLQLGNLAPGAWRYLTEGEVKALLEK